MQFYRRLTPFKAISFDLDDTLYNNRPVMLAIEKQMVEYFAHQLADFASQTNTVFNRQFWSSFRNKAIQTDPELTHDVVFLRLETYRLGLISLGLNDDEANKEAQAALDYFITLRSDFSVPETSKQLLAYLSQYYPLVAISNGNVDTKALGIDHYFQYIYHAGFQKNVSNIVKTTLLKQKPAADMFSLVCQKLTIKPEHLLHVGDCGFADIHGALNAGCQTAWLPHYGVGKPLKQLPHIALNVVNDLTQLVSL